MRYVGYTATTHTHAYKFDEFFCAEGRSLFPASIPRSYPVPAGIVAPREAVLGDTIIECYGKIIREILPQRRLAACDSNVAVTDAENDIAIRDDVTMPKLVAVMGNSCETNSITSS